MAMIPDPEEPELTYKLQDTEWPLTSIDHERLIARAVVYDEEGFLYFVRVDRDDDFGKAVLIETSGGGVEPDETPEEAVCRELREELGIRAAVVCPLGTVTDAYHLIRRRNVNRYFLCRVCSFCEKSLTPDEKDRFRLSTLRLRPEDALREYERNTAFPLGRLITARELPILRHALTVLSPRISPV